MAHAQRQTLNSKCTLLANFYFNIYQKGVYELYKRLTEAMQNEDTPTRKSGDAKIGQIILVDRSKIKSIELILK